jgi:hypothetical protein
MQSFKMSSSCSSSKQISCSPKNLIENNNEKIVVKCFIPVNVTNFASLLKKPNSSIKKITTDESLVVIPANVIIDKIEFFGFGFSTLGSFNIGLGQLNNKTILNLLIENATENIANEKQGGCREFLCNSADGSNSKNLVLTQSFVNIVTEQPTNGNLMVLITYHPKPKMR